MHDNWPSIDGVSRSYFPHKVEERARVLWHTVVRPHCEVELLYDPLLFRALFLEGEGADSVLRQCEHLLNLDTELSIDIAPLWPVLVALQLKRK